MNTAKYGNQDNGGIQSTAPISTAPVPMAAMSTAAPKTTSIDYAKQLANIQREQKQAELERAKAIALSNLKAEQARTNQNTNTAMSDADTRSNINIKNFAEDTANRGQTYSGSTSQGDLSLKIANQNSLSALETARQNALADIERRKALADENYQYDLSNANTTIGISEMQNLIDLQNQQDQLNRTEQEKAMNNSINTVGQYGNDFMAEIQRREALDPNDPLLPYLRMARQDKISGIAEQQSKIAETEYEKNLEQAKLMANMGDFSGLKALGYDTTQLERKWNTEIADTQSQTANRNSNEKAEKNYSSVYSTAMKMKSETEPLPFGLQGTRQKIWRFRNYKLCFNKCT